jgi:hypothetical protein
MMMKIKEATLIVCLAWGGAWAAETPDPTLKGQAETGAG